MYEAFSNCFIFMAEFNLHDQLSRRDKIELDKTGVGKNLLDKNRCRLFMLYHIC